MPGPMWKALEFLNEDLTHWLNSPWLMVLGNYLLTNMKLFAAICHVTWKSQTDMWFRVIWNMVNQQQLTFSNLPEAYTYLEKTISLTQVTCAMLVSLHFTNFIFVFIYQSPSRLRSLQTSPVKGQMLNIFVDRTLSVTMHLSQWKHIPMDHMQIGGKHKAHRPNLPLHLVLSSPAPWFYPVAAPSSLPLLKE